MTVGLLLLVLRVHAFCSISFNRLFVIETNQNESAAYKLLSIKHGKKQAVYFVHFFFTLHLLLLLFYFFIKKTFFDRAFVCPFCLLKQRYIF